ncbi:uncharacterized protein ALTATR162_LOCUS1834 [Alternaria atra]|uniref:Xylanolytic transcriptional activator regulatory domain-containing protein n=1 Tax=Alternaria atra TaxID=119953 RepID=A0A8J2N2H1_9PLEO|nr:uncharacterized protein ALTATR162_LOCUS1834 [Alternaria atra]CAG5146173.1 unnamed protein product [Alternaria atra]
MDTTTRRVFQERIDQLESLVRSLLGKQEEKLVAPLPGSVAFSMATNIAADADPLTYEVGRMNLENHEFSYVESDHWKAILDEIGDLKEMVQQQPEDSLKCDLVLPGNDLFLLQTYPDTKMDVIAAIPPRIVVDSMISKYFKWADMPVSLVIHRKVFFKQYEAFWEDPLSTPTIWLTILYGMMYTVAYCTLFINGGSGSLDETTAAEYHSLVMISREKMIQCLRLGNYLKGAPHTIEALLAFLQTEYVQGEDTQQGCWQLTGVIIRVALKMGYHRDGSQFREMSVYEAEMRRRTWYILAQFDTASASQVGLPRIIKETQCDTAEPRNLLDDDFDDTSTVLPPARPQNEHTLAQFLVYKSRVISVYGMICDFTTSSKQRDYAEAIRLDALLNTAYTQKPPILELKFMQRSVLDGAELITRRLYMAMSYHHAQITLHRKFMILAKVNSKYTLSCTTCLNAALTILRLQAELFEQCQPGRMLHADRWKILSLTQSEFLLATTVLCFNLYDDVKKRLFGGDVARKSVEALEGSRRVWEQQGFSKEAQTAVKAIDVVLGKLHSSLEKNNAGKPQLSGAHASSASSFSADMGSGDGQSVDLLSYKDCSDTEVSYKMPQDSDSMAFGDFFEMDQEWEGWLQL